MTKLELLLFVCGFGTIFCTSNEQQVDYADNLITEIEYAAEEIDEMLTATNQNTEAGRNIILMHANSLNFDMHFILDCLQHVASKNEQHVALQEVVLKLNSIAYDLEESFEKRITFVKMQLRKSVNNIVKEAKNLQKIIQENPDQLFTATALRFLDDLVTATQKVYIRGGLQRLPKILIKFLIQTVRRSLTLFLSLINSQDMNVYNDIVRYSSKVSSSISETSNLLKDLTYTYKTDKYDEVKEIVYSLGKISQNNEEVLYNEKSFKKIKEQLRVTIVSLSEQLTKMVDVGISSNGRDDNLLYVFLPEIVAQGMQLQRNFEFTYKNYIDVLSNN